MRDTNLIFSLHVKELVITRLTPPAQIPIAIPDTIPQVGRPNPLFTILEGLQLDWGDAYAAANEMWCGDELFLAFPDETQLVIRMWMADAIHMLRAKDDISMSTLAEDVITELLMANGEHGLERVVARARQRRADAPTTDKG